MRGVVPEFFLISSVKIGVGERDENYVRGSGKDSLAVREASTGRVAFVPVTCAWTGASAGKAGACHNSTVQSACSRQCSNRSSLPFGGNQMARSTSGHDLGVRRRHQKGPGTRGVLAERLRLARARSQDQPF